MITAFATKINRRRRARAAPYVPTAAFLLGYLIVWTGFSVIATASSGGTGNGSPHYNDAIFILLLVGCTLRRCRSLPTQPIEGDGPSRLPFAHVFILSDGRDGCLVPS